MDSVFKLIGRLILGVLRPDSVEAKSFHQNEPKMRIIGGAAALIASLCPVEQFARFLRGLSKNEVRREKS